MKLTERLRLHEQRIGENNKIETECGVALVTAKGKGKPGKPSEKNKNSGKENSGKGPKCFYCKDYGHFREDCPTLKAKNAAKGRGDVNLLVLCGDRDRFTWLVDSGASHHLITKSGYFSQYTPFETPRPLILGDGREMYAYGEGLIKAETLVNGTWISVSLNGVWFIPGGNQNLFSVSSALDHGLIQFSNSKRTEFRKKSGEVVAVGERLSNGVYELLIRLIKPDVCAAAVGNADCCSIQVWHERLAHQNKRHVKDFLNGWGIKVKTSGEPDEKLCDGCMYGKMHRLKFGNRKDRPTKPGDLINADVCGPMEGESLGGKRYYVVFKDDFSKFRVVYFLKRKSEVIDKLVDFLAQVKTLGIVVKEFLTDGGGEFDNTKVDKAAREAGLNHRITMPYTPEQKGAAERENRILVEAARTMLYSCELSEDDRLCLWAEAINTAAYVINRTGPSSVTNKTPYELWFGKPAAIDHLKIFGTECFVHIPKQKRKKFDKKALKGFFVGYCGDKDGYRIYIPAKKEVVLSRDVVFKSEKIFKESCVDDKPNIANRVKAEPRCVNVEPRCVNAEPNRENAESDYLDNDNFGVIFVPGFEGEERTNDNLPAGNIEIRENEIQENVDLNNVREENFFDDHEFPGQPVIDDDDIDDSLIVASDVAPASTSGMSLRNRNNLKRPSRYDDCVLMMMAENSSEPSTFRQAMTSVDSDKWQEAMKDELFSLAENKVYELVDLPPGKKVLNNKWVFKIKRNPDGSVDRYKARLVVKGYLQEESVDYFETFSPVIRWDTVRTLLSVAANQGLKLTQFDVKTAFLYGNLEEELYMKQPEGFNDDSGRVCRLLRSLYGLKQAPRCWHKRFKDFLFSLGFVQSEADPCLFFMKEKSLFLALYVDDGLIVVGAKDQKVFDEFLRELKKSFEVKIGDVKCYLGLEIDQFQDGSIFINQKAYCEKVLKRFKMDEANPVATPFEKFVNDNKKCNQPYREAVGSLMFLALVSRPDLAFVTSYLSRFLADPLEVHWKLVERVFKYLRGTSDHGILYQNQYKPGILESYSDSDYAGDSDTRKSTSGVLLKYSGGSIIWRSLRQRCVALSTTEAEYVAACATTQEIIWVKRLLAEISIIKETPTLKIDNRNAIRLIKNPELHQKSKHIDVRYKFIQQCFEEGVIDVEAVSTKLQLADIFTKFLPNESFKDLKIGIGMRGKARVEKKKRKKRK